MNSLVRYRGRVDIPKNRVSVKVSMFGRDARRAGGLTKSNLWRTDPFRCKARRALIQAGRSSGASGRGVWRPPKTHCPWADVTTFII